MTEDRRKVLGRFAAWPTAAALAIVALGCGTSDREVAVGELGFATTAAGSPTAAGQIVDDQIVDDQIVDDGAALGRIHTSDLSPDPDADNWETERFGQAAQAQLVRLAQEFVAGEAPLAAGLEDLLTPSFRCASPGDELRTVFRDAALVVERPALHGVDGQMYIGAQGLAELLANLRSGDVSPGNARCKFKVFRVSEDGEWTTAARWDYFVESSHSGRQQSAIWVCRWAVSATDQPPRLQSVSIVDYERVTRVHTELLFADCTEAVLGANESYHQQLAYGLDHWLQRLPLFQGIVGTSYHGLAVGDANGDNLEDVYICQPGGISGGLPNRLYLQQPDGTARDVSESAGVDWLTESHSALFLDLDNDADQDLVVATIAGLILAENDGQGAFRERVLKLLPEAPPLSLAAADFDNDGDLDIYACCYAPRNTGSGLGRPLPYHDANNGSRNVLLRNDREWRFTDVANQVGLDDNNRRFSFAAAWDDFDNDGDQDLYVANDFGRNNLYRNDQGRFTDIAGPAGVEDMSAGMSVAWGDADNDGWMDLYVSNMWSSAGNRIAYQSRFLPADGGRDSLGGFQRHARGNSLFLNQTKTGSARFTDVSTQAHVTMAGWAWSSRFIDVNNDGWQDLLVANGYITQDDERDL